MPMSNTKFLAMVQATLLKCIEVMQTKGKEYTESSDNKLANFEAESLETNVPVLDIIHIFANKHQKAINNYRKTGRVESEALEMRFVDRINYLFLELAECIALGYEPREDWLREALESESAAPKTEVVQEPQVDPEGGGLHAEGRQPEPEEPCCGHPGNEQCCEKVSPAKEVDPPAGQDAPPSTPPAQEKRARRRPPRPRTPQTSRQDDEDIPIATPDRRLNPEVIAERARAKRQSNE